jgi:DNA polymerase-1
MDKSLYLIDGSAAIYRAYHAVRGLTTAAGLPTNAVFGFTQILLKIVQDRSPDALAVVFDAKGPTFRHAIYPDYKIHRPAMPDDLALQIPSIHRMVEAMQIPAIIQAGYEADDLIGTLARQADEAGFRVVIVSGDKDMDQLVTPNVVRYDPMKEKTFTERDVLARWGVRPSQIIELFGLMGDASDGIPGIKGIGEKTAQPLIATFGTIENLLARLDEVEKPKLRATLAAGAASARLSRTLATIDVHSPVSFDPDQYARRPLDAARLLPLCRELEFTRLIQMFSQGAPPSQDASPSQDVQDVQAVQVATIAAADLGPILTAIEKCGHLAFVPRSDADDATWHGVALATQDDTFYLPLEEGLLPLPLCALLASETLVKYGYDVKRHLAVCRTQGVTPRALWDVRIAAYLLAPGRRDDALAQLAFAHLDMDLPSDSSPASLGAQARAVLDLARHFTPQLEAQGMLPLFSEIEMPLVSVLSEMEQYGVGLDVAAMIEMSKELEEKRAALTQEIYRLAGGEFNVQSPKQLADILFDKLGLPVLRKTKTGRSTDEEVLTQLALQHPLPAAIVESRQLGKLQSTYVDVLPRFVRGGRVHTRFNQTVAATGRLSSVDPNLQNIPVRGEWGRRIRTAFVAAPGCVLLSADYNQIELRILAHLSDDAALLEAFQQGEDVHLQTATGLFGLPKEAISTDMRRAAKTVNFGVIYGISPFGLATQLGVSQAEAKRYIDAYFERYRGVAAWIQRTSRDAAATGFVTTLFGRRRPIARHEGALRGADERLAINTPVQGSAADIIKRAMIDVAHWMRQAQVASKMILQVHDELIFEVSEGEIARMREQVTRLMEGAARLSVPLTVDVGMGKTWAEAH